MQFLNRAGIIAQRNSLHSERVMYNGASIWYTLPCLGTVPRFSRRDAYFPSNQKWVSMNVLRVIGGLLASRTSWEYVY